MRKAVYKYCKSKLMARSTNGLKYLYDYIKTCSTENKKKITNYSKKLKVVKDKEGNAKLKKKFQS